MIYSVKTVLIMIPRVKRLINGTCDLQCVAVSATASPQRGAWFINIQNVSSNGSNTKENETINSLKRMELSFKVAKDLSI